MKGETKNVKRWTAIKTQLASRLFGDVIQQSVEARVQQAIAAPFGLADPSLYGFRRLTGRENQAALRDLPLPTHERMQDIAYWLYLANPMAQWFTNMQAAYVAGDGVTLASKDEQVQEVLDAFWDDATNAWEASLEDYVRELGMYGEQCWPVFVSPGSGLVRLGYLDPCLIEEVVIDPENAKQAIGVVTKDNYQGIRTGQRRYKTALLIPEDELTPAAQAEREKFTDGACFYFAVNKVSNGSRGWSDLLCKADWMDGYEQFLFQRLERSDLANRVVSDVTMTGATPEQVAAYMKTFQLPPPGGHFIHNEKIELEMKAPNLNAQDAETDARMFKHQAISPAPEHWYGGGGDVNRSTASEMDESTFKVFKQRQNKVKAFIKTVARYQIQEAKRAGALKQSADDKVDITMPEMVKADLTKLSSSAQATANSVGTMLTQGLINKEEGRKIYAVAIKPMGIELEDKKQDQLEAEAAERDLNDASADYREPGKTGNVTGEMQAGVNPTRKPNDASRETSDEGGDAER